MLNQRQRQRQPTTTPETPVTPHIGVTTASTVQNVTVGETDGPTQGEGSLEGKVTALKCNKLKDPLNL